MIAEYNKVTIVDIAKIAKVSITTVSRVINDKKVRKATKERVLGIIQRCEYCPDPYAQYLGKKNHSGTIRKAVGISGS